MVQPSCRMNSEMKRSDNRVSGTAQASRDELKQTQSTSSVDKRTDKRYVLVLCRQAILGHEQMLEANIPSL